MAAGNDEAGSIPMAVAAGLGRMGRSGMLLSEKFGSCIRLCKVFTDLPLIENSTDDSTDTMPCKTCRACAKACPGDAIGEGPFEGRSLHSEDKCDAYWAKGHVGCAICIAACPMTP